MLLPVVLYGNSSPVIWELLPLSRDFLFLETAVLKLYYCTAYFFCDKSNTILYALYSYHAVRLAFLLIIFPFLLCNSLVKHYRLVAYKLQPLCWLLAIYMLCVSSDTCWMFAMDPWWGFVLFIQLVVWCKLCLWGGNGIFLKATVVAALLRLLQLYKTKYLCRELN